MRLSCVRHQPRTALTSGDVAAYVDLPPAVVAAALAEWTAIGLIEGHRADDLVFYRLTRERWVESLWRVAHHVDLRIHLPRASHGHLVPAPPTN